MSRPRVVVLLPVRDEEPFLAECLESLSAQTLSDFEVIAVDDGSVDATPGILAAHARGDSRFRVLRQEPAGMVAASERARAGARRCSHAWTPTTSRCPSGSSYGWRRSRRRGSPRSAAGSSTSPTRPTGCARTPTA